jgi:purine-nucleoside phosphorylase
MITQVSFTTESELKKKALEKAKKEGITLKTVLLYSMKAFVEGKIHFGVISQEEPEVEEVVFEDKGIREKAGKLAKLLK